MIIHLPAGIFYRKSPRLLVAIPFALRFDTPQVVPHERKPDIPQISQLPTRGAAQGLDFGTGWISLFARIRFGCLA